MLYEYGKRARDCLRAFLFFLKFSFLYFWGVLNKTIILLALVGYDCSCWLCTISYTTHACGIIIVKYYQ